MDWGSTGQMMHDMLHPSECQDPGAFHFTCQVHFPVYWYCQVIDLFFIFFFISYCVQLSIVLGESVLFVLFMFCQYIYSMGLKYSVLQFSPRLLCCCSRSIKAFKEHSSPSFMSACLLPGLSSCFLLSRPVLLPDGRPIWWESLCPSVRIHLYNHTWPAGCKHPVFTEIKRRLGGCSVRLRRSKHSKREKEGREPLLLWLHH